MQRCEEVYQDFDFHVTLQPFIGSSDRTSEIGYCAGYAEHVINNYAAPLGILVGEGSDGDRTQFALVMGHIFFEGTRLTQW